MVLSVSSNRGPIESASSLLSPGENTRRNQAAGSQSLERASVSVDPQRDRPDAPSESRSANNVERDRAANALFAASQSLSERREITDRLTQSVERLAGIADAIARETNPSRRESLIAEANAVAAGAQSEFNRSVEDSPTVTAEVAFTATFRGGAAEGNQTQIALQAVRTPEQLGLDQLDFSQPEQAAASLANAESSLRASSNSFQSSSTEVASVSRNRIREALTDRAAGDDADLDRESVDLARSVALSASRLPEISAVERLDTPALLAMEEAEIRSESRASLQQGPGLSMDNASMRLQDAADRDDPSNTDSATLGNRIVQN